MDIVSSWALQKVWLTATSEGEHDVLSINSKRLSTRVSNPLLTTLPYSPHSALPVRDLWKPELKPPLLLHFLTALITLYSHFSHFLVSLGPL